MIDHRSHWSLQAAWVWIRFSNRNEMTSLASENSFSDCDSRWRFDRWSPWQIFRSASRRSAWGSWSWSSSWPPSCRTAGRRNGTTGSGLARGKLSCKRYSDEGCGCGQVVSERAFNSKIQVRILQISNYFSWFKIIIVFVWQIFIQFIWLIRANCFWKMKPFRWTLALSLSDESEEIYRLYRHKRTLPTYPNAFYYLQKEILLCNNQ